MAKYLTEFIGTFFLCLTIGLTVIGGHPMPGLPIGFSLMIMVYMGGPISGGHYNPAVTTAAVIRGALPASQAIPYMVSQLVGAMAAALLTGVITGDVISPEPSPDISTGMAVLVEFLFTFALALVVLNVATSKRTQGNSYFGLAIGSTILVASAAGVNTSGAAFNPAVGVGLGLIDGLMGGAPMGHLWIYILGPIAGGIAGAYVFLFQERSE